MNDPLGDIAAALRAAAPFVLFPAAAGAGLAIVLGHRRWAASLLLIAILAVVVTLGVGMWWTLSLPPT